ncbi:hypothetical protein [Duganella dendranthematis]|uniref:hypothetical protein n=1 Tax=Duganella dendranthematis TaxID=2728021 RepID=UPI001E3082BE|nr:hypothetical protein [Duganella dendranthematis]
MQAFADAANPSQLRYDADECRLLGTGDGAQIINLDNGYRAYCAAPRKERAQALANFVRV